MKIGLIQTAALFAMASLGTAQTVRWTTPVLGYYFDSDSKSIRTIAGVPGSAALEGGLAVGSKLERAAVSPSRDYAFATVLDSDKTLLVSFSGSSVDSSRALDEAASGFDSAYFSPDGRSAALVWKSEGRVQIWTGLPGSASLTRETQILDFTALAVSNGGDRVAIADANGVRLLGTDTALLSGAGWSALAFSGADLAAANPDAGQVAWISGDRQASFEIAGAQAVAFSADGSRLLVAAAKQVVSIDVASRATSSVACDCSLNGLERVQGNTVFRVSAPKDGYMALYDADGVEPRITLIAAGGNQ